MHVPVRPSGLGERWQSRGLPAGRSPTVGPRHRPRTPLVRTTRPTPRAGATAKPVATARFTQAWASEALSPSVSAKAAYVQRWSGWAAALNSSRSCGLSSRATHIHRSRIANLTQDEGRSKGCGHCVASSEKSSEPEHFCHLSRLSGLFLHFTCLGWVSAGRIQLTRRPTPLRLRVATVAQATTFVAAHPKVNLTSILPRVALE